MPECSPQANVCCIGISGGHSSSTALAVTPDGDALAAVPGESLNFHTFHHDVVTQRLESLLDSLARRLCIERKVLLDAADRTVVAFPGAATKEDQALAEVCVQAAGLVDKDKHEIADDTWAGLVAGTGSLCGVCAFAGTGASVFVGRGQVAGKPNKIDGWGPIIGDFGSGFELAVEMFRLFGRSYDQGQMPRLFYDVRTEFPKIRSDKHTQKWFDTLFMVHHDSWRITFAETARVATHEADSPDPDPVAVRLVTAAAENMAESIEIAIKRCAPDVNDLRIVFQGGMFRYSALYTNVVASRIRHLTTGQVSLSRFRPVVGAALMALAGLGPSKQFSQELVEVIGESIGLLDRQEQQLLYTVSS